ncbi:phosphate regulon sensor histidine kinase PhoR [Variovorax sp. HJSM1_2]|uniref:phosphate regulon sensor histidine kinase PhoR n=1 Tax=Variovorax sp. HJSM1_2 TaxID=3366263 RepID=UPI003BCE166F
MLYRSFYFLACQLLGGVIGWHFLGRHLGHDRGALVGLALSSVVWLAIDLIRAGRVLRWLRVGDVREAPQMHGVWGEATDRMRRLLRQSEQVSTDFERQLREFLAAIQASPNGVVLLNPTGHIEWCNQVAAEHFGLDLERDVHQQIGNLVRDPAFAAGYARAVPGARILMLGRTSTASRPVRLAVQMHPYGDGHRLLLSHDVTALEQAEAMRRDFVANVSHEIRTPLTVLSGFVETLQNFPLEEAERRRYLDHMAQQADRMQSLVQDLLTLSRIEGSPMPGSSDWISLRKLYAECTHEAQALSALLTAGKGKSHMLHFGPVPEGEISGVSSELQSAMSNLVGNAVRYTPAPGRIDVEWQTQADGRLAFSVQDTGPGIAAEHIPRITERFYRVDTSRSRETGGTGLGLAIVKHVLQRHGAELRIESTLGQGSRFAILFPANRLRLATSKEKAVLA